MSQNTKLLVSVFFTGGSIMIYEILASRIFAPFFGTSTYIWTNIIGVIMASLSLGYYLGGRYADRHPDTKHLVTLIFASAVLLTLTNLFQNPLLLFARNSSASTGLASFLASLLLFAPLSVLLGMVSPFVARLTSEKIKTVGASVGNVYAVSTAGSIVGTFLAGFVLVPSLQIANILYIIAFLLFGLAFWLDGVCRIKVKFSILLVLILLIFFFNSRLSFAQVFSTSSEKIIADIPTEYSRVWISEEQYPLARQRTFSDGQSSIYIIPQSAGEVVIPSSDIIRAFRLYQYYAPQAQDFLLIGGAGYVFPKYLQELSPNAKIDTVEINPDLLQIAQDYFYFEPSENFRNIAQDGRVYLNENEKKYDVIILDAFNNNSAIPFQLVTEEATQKIYDSLSENGVFLCNTISALDGKNARFLEAQYTTLNEIFEKVILIPIQYPELSQEKQNVLVVGLKGENDNYALMNLDMELQTLLGQIWHGEIKKGVTLSDSYAPVEYLQ